MLETPVFNAANLTCITAAVAGWQLWMALRFAARLRRQAASEARRYAPPVSVIIACKGQPRYFDQNILSLIDQDYAGDREFVFVSPSAADPAYARLKTLLGGRPEVQTRLLHSDAVPVRCSEKILNLLFALRHVSDKSEVLAFADCDVWLPRDWLRRLVAPLEQADTIAVSAPALYAADTLNPLQILQMAWMGMVACIMDSLGSIFGWSWAIRRKDFKAVGIEQAWASSLTDDFVLNKLLRRTGKRIEWALPAMPVCRENPGFGQVLTPFIKGYRYFRVYDRFVWILGGCEALGKLALFLWFLKAGMPLRALVFPAVDALVVILLFEALKRWAPAAAGFIHPALRRHTFFIAAVTPVLLVLRLWVFIVSAWSTKIRWGGYLYHMKSAADIRVLGTIP